MVHDVRDYPAYYDALYYPLYHEPNFATPRSFCSWLLQSLGSHHRSCHRCNIVFAGCVSFDGHRVVVTSRERSVSLSLTYFERASYHHCALFRALAHSSPASDFSACSLSRHPPWLFASEENICSQLRTLPVSTLSRTVTSLESVHVHPRTKPNFIHAIWVHFERLRTSILAQTLTEVVCGFTAVQLPPGCDRDFLRLLCAFVDDTYGFEVAAAIRRPAPPIYSYDPVDDDVPSWMTQSTEDLVQRLRKTPIAVFSESISRCPLLPRPVYHRRAHAQTANSLVCHIRTRATYLRHAGYPILCDIWFAYSPFSDRNVSPVCELVTRILVFEYGPAIVEALNHDPLSKSDRRKVARRAQKQSLLSVVASEAIDRVNRWPQIVPERTVLACQVAYFEGTQWEPEPVCAVCAQHLVDCQSFIFSDMATSELHLESLRLTDTFIIQKCVLQQLSSRFTFGSTLIDGLMLERAGVVGITHESVTLNVCGSCQAALRKPDRVPRLALKNGLYRGDLPVQFHDLTWIEEKICAIYCVTAHVTRLFQSADPAQAKTFHGNTCAHEMNVVSTATVLPRTPADVNGLLSVVFVGPGKFDPKTLGTVFRVRRQKIWSFLVWLKHHNRLYSAIGLDSAISLMYPDDDILPGLSDGVIEDHDIDVRKVFDEETAGFSHHPADMLGELNSPVDVRESADGRPSPVPTVMIEKMGVSDPECDKISGRACTAAALRNLHSRNGREPDLVVHRGIDAIPEYKNPDLLPGMFPTLYPYGIGGFEDKQRDTPLSFEQQARHYLNLPDRAFRYHHSYLFVVLNILQRRAAHLHTFFTVRKSNFQMVARRLSQVSAAVLESLASKLEREHKLSSLTAEEQGAMTLLQQVNTISARIPGSHASKIYVRNEIRAYFSYFGLPHLFFTFNPSPSHSPVFQVMFGDRSVDLSSCFPKLVCGRERALRLAQDPVAGADFFEFMWRCCFEHLLGWDFSKRRSSIDGGLFGRIRAFYGSSEYTERGSLHGHYLIWLEGACNPSDMHVKLQDAEFQRRFFAFFEGIIHHHLPDIEADVDPKFEPRVERPPQVPLDLLCDEHPPPHLVKEWESTYSSQIKQCGEALQRHACRTVCHKYGNDSSCRFMFPHEVVDESYFDAATNSVVFKCKDGTVNYFNPDILVCCRHNHDLRCILSGKSAKAAMFYISDYITKMDTKTYEMLSLLSRAVSRMPTSNGNDSPSSRARTLLHKCLSQFTRQQQIHAQQAARYIRGLGDGIPSHVTVPMLSSLLLSCVSNSTLITERDGADIAEEDAVEEIPTRVENTDDDDELEDVRIRVATDERGQIVECNQVHHYLLRAPTLSDMCFYDFCRCVRLQTKARSKDIKNTHETRLGVLQRHALQAPHPLAQTHELIEHTNESRGEGTHEFVPRVVGMSIPRSSDTKKWMLFALAHFKPFSSIVPLIPQNSTLEEAYASHEFSARGLAIMKHWEAVHECEDERDADRLRRRAQLTTSKKETLHSSVTIDDDVDVLPSDPFCKSALEEFKMNQFILLLKQSQWLADSESSPAQQCHARFGDEAQAASEYNAQLMSLDCNPRQLKQWSIEIKDREDAIAETRRNALNPDNQSASTMRTVKDTFVFDSTVNQSTHSPPPTEYAPPSCEQMAPSAVIQQTGDRFQLNEKQWIAFRIIAENFVHKYIEKRTDTAPQLTMLMTGPGGTGKTHVVKAVRAVMEYYGYGHIIRFLAPTGSAAALIDGMTIHKGLGIKIKATNKGKGNRKPGDSLQDYSVIVSNQNKSQLREEWKNVGYLLVDEASLLGLQLLAQLDHALRVAKERPDLWFGGVALILSGDFFQYAPVGGTALYTPISRYAGQTDDEIQKRLGRLAWKTVSTVVTLTEQQRMKLDPEYAEAVTRLRVRSCTYADVELFNSRTIRSANNLSGVDMGTPENITAAAIVATNNVREALNARKAEASCGGHELVTSNASDRCTHHELTLEERRKLLRMNFNNVKASNPLPGIVRLYVGMPVILRVRNISTELGITNGSQGIVRHLVTEVSPSRLTHVKCAIVEFPTSKVNLSNLPPRYFPILPVAWTFTTLLEDDQGTAHKLRITRHQLPIQPAFAVTGHSAQGKTLPSVLVNLQEGGFGAYVAASRARTRQGLCITHPVTMDQLNKPLPVDLVREVQRFEAIEHNTYIRCGLRAGEYVQIPDAEAERSIVTAPICPTLTPPASRATAKRKRSNHVENRGDLEGHDESPLRKKIKTNSRVGCNDPELTDTDLAVNYDTPDLFHAGCSWDATNWSCAYDCVFMILYGIYASEDADWRESWRYSNPLTSVLASSYTSLMQTRDRVNRSFDVHRDAFRDALSDLHPSFPRHGQVGASASAVLDRLIPYGGCRPYVSMVCFNGCNVWETTKIHSADLLPTLCTLPIWTTIAGAVNFAQHSRISIKTWISIFLQSIVYGNNSIWSTMTCPECGAHTLSPVPCFSATPSILMFEDVPGAVPRLIPSDTITLPTANADAIYDLRGVVGIDGFHFTSRLFDKYPSQRQWTYDGQKHAGRPKFIQPSLRVRREAEFIFVYSLRS